MQTLLQESEEGEREPNPLPPDSVNGNSPKSSDDGQISPIKEETPLNTSNREIIPEKIQPVTLTPPISQLPLVSEVRLRRSVSDVNVNRKPDKQTKSYAGLPPAGTLKHTNSQVFTISDIFVCSMSHTNACFNFFRYFCLQYDMYKLMCFHNFRIFFSEVYLICIVYYKWYIYQ